ncbi:cytochrome P450 6B6-like [Maniola jurtina]|uniref:cytochrome P450 6B6-like n=1 Tax=Maniola jurtina TaxID=191418 RepID=UPI001E68713E|nr:cytochrome P450 6B6-like [Maniola jurtina]
MTSPTLLIRDLDVIKNVLIKDFEYFEDRVKDVTQARNGIPSNRKDFIDLILEAKNQGNILETKEGDNVETTIKCVKLTNEVIAAQAFIFYTAGYETNATTAAYMLYELAMNPQIQEKLIAEVDEVLNRHDGKISYELISELPYMEKVLNETLRKYPVIDIQRRAKANYNIPGTNITIEKGTNIVVPTLGISYDEKYYPNPTNFDPERFSPESESKRHSCAFIPFGIGPRYCIGMMFARIQSRVFLMKLLSNFRVETSKNTQTTITFNPGRVVTAPKDGIYLNLIPRKSQYDAKNK